MATIDTIADRSTGTTIAGKAYFETSTNKFIVYNGSAWIQLDSDGVGAVYQNRWGASFDGSSDFLYSASIPRPNSVAWANSTPVSQSAWVKLRTENPYRPLFGYGNGPASGSNSGIYTTTTPGTWMFYLSNSFHNISHSFSLNTWYHITFTFDGTANEAKVYVDGALKNTFTDNNNSLAGNYQFHVVAGGGGRWNQFQDCFVDELATWDSTLSASDAATVYNNGAPSDLSPLNPLVWYKMGDDSSDSATSGGSIATITDSSGNGNDVTQGTASAQPTFSDLTGESIYL